MKKGRLVIISGPSGVGKGTVIEMLLKRHSRLIKRAVTATTRPPRPGEKEGVDHYFLSKAEFKKKLEAGEFLEHNKFDFHLYGTLRETVAKALESTEVEIIEVDVGGAKEVKEAFPDAVLIFIDAPNKEELEARLRGRHTEDTHDLEVRLSKASKETAVARDEFDHIIVNPTGHPEKAVDEIEKILGLS